MIRDLGLLYASYAPRTAAHSRIGDEVMAELKRKFSTFLCVLSLVWSAGALGGVCFFLVSVLFEAAGWLQLSGVALHYPLDWWGCSCVGLGRTSAEGGGVGRHARMASPHVAVSRRAATPPRVVPPRRRMHASFSWVRWTARACPRRSAPQAPCLGCRPARPLPPRVPGSSGTCLPPRLPARQPCPIGRVCLPRHPPPPHLPYPPPTGRRSSAT